MPFTLLLWALLFFAFALIAATFGFGDIVASAAGTAKLLAGLFVVLGFVLLVAGLVRRRLR